MELSRLDCKRTQA